ADKKERLYEGECQGGKKYRQKDIEHSLLRVLGADFNDFLAICYRSLHHALKLDIGFDEFDGPICARGHRLSGGAGKPVDHGTASDQAKHERRVQKRKIIYVLGKTVGKRHDDGENHGGGTDHGGTNQDRLGRSLKRVASAVIFFQQILGAFEVCVDVEVLLQFLLNVGN